MSKVTSICGTPRGADGIPSSPNLPEQAVVGGHRPLALEHLHLDRALVVGAVENVSLFLVGIVVLRG
jgi:hypothetical protein